MPFDPTRRNFLATAASLTAAGGVRADGREPASPQTTSPLLRGTAEHCIMIWLGGGAAQIDTFDPKRQSSGPKDPGSAYASIETAISDCRVCEHLSRSAPLLDRAVIVRTLHHDEVDEHAAASYRLHVGRKTSATVVYPSLGAVISNARGPLDDAVPPYVLMGYPSPGRSPGFLGSSSGYVYLTTTQSGPRGLVPRPSLSGDRHARRLKMLEHVTREYARRHSGDALVSEYIDSAQRGFKMASSEFMDAFDLKREDADLRAAYGDEFGQRCLLARRLLQRGTRFVEVSFNMGFVNGTGWDTHNAGQKNQHHLIRRLDAALASLIEDLEHQRMLDKTLIVVATEFGRPAKFDAGGGRGHHAGNFCGLLAGGGLRTGQVVGETDELAMKPGDVRVSVPDWFATIYAALGIDYTQDLYAGERPVPMTDGGQPIASLFSA